MFKSMLCFFSIENKNEKQNKKHRNHAFDNPIRIRKSYFVIWTKTNRIRYRFYCFVAVSLCGGYQRVKRRYEWSEKLFRKKIWHPRVDHLCAKKGQTGRILWLRTKAITPCAVLVTELTITTSGRQAVTFDEAAKKHIARSIFWFSNVFLVSALFIFRPNFRFTRHWISFYKLGLELPFFSLCLSFSFSK